METIEKRRTLKNMYYLNPNDIPQQWFNILPHLGTPLPPPEDVIDKLGSRIDIMNKIRVSELLAQDKSQDKWLDIPARILEAYVQVGRPTPLMRAYNLEKYLDTPAKIYIKREDLLPTGSFKLNTSLAQAYYAKEEGAEGLVSETGAGQWGLSLAYSCNTFGMKSNIFWVKVSCQQKPYRVLYSKLLGANVIPSPSMETEAGKEILRKNPTCTGSIGTGISEAINFARENSHYKYVSGSNLPHVLLHQSIIGLETKKQLEQIGEKPDMLIACVGGGSNLGGLMFPFFPQKLQNGLVFFGAESDAAPRLTLGEYKYDHSDPVGLTPKTLSYTLGNDYIPPPVHVGGLRQHNGSAIIGILRNKGFLDAKAYSQEEAFQAGKVFTQYEKVLPAPETNHAIKAAIDFALQCKERRESKVIVLCFSGTGLLDLMGYKEVLNIQ